jgi:hypothetical protein
VNGAAHTVKESQVYQGNWINTVIDGAGGQCQNHTSNSLKGPIAAVERTNCTNVGPYVFYQDGSGASSNLCR